MSQKIASSASRPAVSIILPTYNRARFLPQAFASIRSQRFTDWELFVVDDGSTDDTQELTSELTRGWPQPVHYHRQENQGAYGARNTGLDLACGEYIAFYDSDDVWLPHHLEDGVSSLRQNPEVDWVYGASRIVDFASGKVQSQNCFFMDGRPRPFLNLRHKAVGPLRIIDDPGTVECMLLHGMYCGLQCSVLRRRVFSGFRFEAIRRNEAEDQLIVVQTLVRGGRLGYLNNVHVVYHVHDQNSSASGTSLSTERHQRVFRAIAEGYEQLGSQVSLTAPQRRALAIRLSRVYFWDLGYPLMREPGKQREALALFRRGLRCYPWHISYWKTYLWACLRKSCGLAAGGPAASTAEQPLPHVNGV